MPEFDQRITFKQVEAALSSDAATVDAIYRKIVGFRERGPLTKRQRRARLAVASILERLEGEGRLEVVMHPDFSDLRTFRKLGGDGLAHGGDG